MKNFSEYLSEYVKGRHMSWRKAAQLSQIDRTLLSRYASGKKLPENMERVIKIAKGLGMEPGQAEELKRAYQVSKMGDYQYRMLEIIRHIYAGQAFWIHSGFPDGSSLPLQDGVPVQRLHGEEEICGALFQLAQGASCLRVQVDGAEEGSLFSQALLQISQDCRVEQFLRLNHAEEKEAEAAKFRSLFPFFCAGKEFKAYCSYQWCRGEISPGGAVEMALSGSGLLLFARDRSSGIFTRQEGYRAYYEGMFQEHVKKCKPYGGNGAEAMEKLSLLERRGCPFLRLENQKSGVTFLYQNLLGESVFVKKGPICICLEEAELVRMFVEFMDYMERISV
ncbi:MAG: helix-turn-helix transcriptional regulator [Lachnospiraceae bacterium]|jgi:transcriptional regulator with XRE-family HTH domain|nr:helix-turn-helix transcriptional regulator [Lachnospiraceae bacterium]